MNVLFDVINVIGVWMEIFNIVSYFGVVAKEKESLLHTKLIMGLLFGVLASLAAVFVKQQFISTALMFVFIFLLSSLYKLSLIKRLSFSVVLMVFSILSEITIGLIMTGIYGTSVKLLNSNIFYYMQGALISRLMVFVLIKIVGYFSIISETKISGYIILPFLFLPIATFLVIYVMSESMFIAEDKIYLRIAAIAVISLIAANVLVFYLFEYQLKEIEAKKQEQLAKQQLEYKAEYYRSLSEKQRVSNKTMHDLKNQLFAIKESFQTDVNDGMNKINAICQKMLSSYVISFTGHESIDALLTVKVQSMNELGILFRHLIYVPENNNIDILELCILLGNLLDNAIEANEKVNSKEKYIDFVMMQQKNYLSIHITNPVSGIVKIENNKIKSTKEHKEIHGFGLQSVTEITEKYNGNCLFRQDEKGFHSIIMLENEV